MHVALAAATVLPTTLLTHYGAQSCTTEHLDEWRSLYDSPQPQLEPLPGGWQARLTPFQRLLPLAALRQDKLTPGISRYVADTMGR